MPQLLLFAELSDKSFTEVLTKYEEAEFFNDYETGGISDAQFRSAIKNELSITASDIQIDEAWNAMLLQVPVSRIEAFNVLRSRYKLFVLSNTNDIHIKKFYEIFDHLDSGCPFQAYFDKVYYSQEIGTRKPNATAWTPILNEYNLSPERTLFIDDRLDNIQAAEKLGLMTFLNKNLDDWLTVLESAEI